MPKESKNINIYILNILTFFSLFKQAFLYSLYLDKWNPQLLPSYIQNYYMKYNDPEKLINLHYMVIDPENVFSDSKPELNYDKISVIYYTHKINIYVVYINISSVSQNKMPPKEQKIVLVIIFFAKYDENKIRKELVMKRKINDCDTIQITNKNIYKLRLKEYNDIINEIMVENEKNKMNKFGWINENLKIFDIIIASWIMAVSFLFKYLIKMGKKKTKIKYNYNHVKDYYFFNKSQDIIQFYKY